MIQNIKLVKINTLITLIINDNGRTIKRLTNFKAIKIIQKHSRLHSITLLIQVKVLQ